MTKLADINQFTADHMFEGATHLDRSASFGARPVRILRTWWQVAGVITPEGTGVQWAATVDDFDQEGVCRVAHLDEIGGAS